MRAVGGRQSVIPSSYPLSYDSSVWYLDATQLLQATPAGSAPAALGWSGTDGREASHLYGLLAFLDPLLGRPRLL
jgi:hypothetical protein